MPGKFSTQVAVITGGTTGIGFAIAQALLEEDVKRVYITGRTKKTLDAAVSSLGERAIAVVSDASRQEDLEKLRREISANGDTINLLFANAGIAKNNAIGDTTEENFDEIFDINVKGVFFTIQTLHPLLSEGASIVLTASIVANKGMENLSLYNASKAAVRSFARSWANDFKARGIRVNAISPGFTRTAIQENSLNMNEQQIADLKEYARQMVPLGYMAQPEEIAAAALFLASADARYVNGIELVVDGGFSQV